MQENRQSRKPSIYNPIKDYEKLVLTAINIGTTAMNKASESELKEAIMAFVSEYGMLALIMTMKNKPQAVMMGFQREYAPTYHIELRERPALVWDFNSLLLCIQMMFSFMLTDDNSSLKVCKHCGKAFAAARSNMEFCSPQCKNHYNVYKSRSKKNDTPTQEV
ncbi:hypothetical protein [Eshraghiella crossota]